jgi:hypothetical protein
MNQTATGKPTIWWVVISLLLGVGLLVDAGFLVAGGNCASLEVPTSIRYRALGSAMRSLCERWGPLAPAAIEALLAVVVLALAVSMWRERRRARLDPSAE